MKRNMKIRLYERKKTTTPKCWIVLTREASFSGQVSPVLAERIRHGHLRQLPGVLRV